MLNNDDVMQGYENYGDGITAIFFRNRIVNACSVLPKEGLEIPSLRPS